MVYNEIHRLVECAIKNGDNSILNERFTFRTTKEKYIFNTAITLIKIWNKQLNNEASKVDFECALRNYLLLVKKELVMPKYYPSERFHDFGLYIDMNTGKVRAKLVLPEFSNRYLVNQLYMQNIKEEDEDKIHNLITNSYIQKLTSFKYFKSNEQKLAVMGALRTPVGYSCLVSMTTGGGKSLITQTVAYQKEGLTLVIVPTISLMLDQFSNSKDIINSNTDEEIFYYHSGCNLDKFFCSLEQKKARLLFVSPESLIKNQFLREKIEKSNDEKYLKNIIIDEAHIIIDWGSSFRIDFQCLDAMRKNFMLKNDELRTFLLSATYSDEVVRQLKMFYSTEERWIEIRCEKLRHETRFDIIKCDNYGEKMNRVLKAIDLLPRPMIVYVKSPNEAENLKEKLCENGYNNIYTFTGETKNDQRQEIISLWKEGQFDLMIATCAFGVGVDKKNVRTVLHIYVPENLNKYYQEAGRGGRDGLPSLSTMIYTEEDVDSAFSFVSKVVTTDKLIGRWFSMLHSSATKPLYNSKYLIDTYVKPDYNANEEFVDYINNQDIVWNVYVILFLRRNGLITIDDIQYVSNKYIFFITILERQLLSNNDKTKAMIDSIRDKEWKKKEYEFLLMKKNLNNVGKICWSDVFTKVYRKTYEYCAGCNRHTDIINFEDNKTLKSDINKPFSKINDEIDAYSYGAKCMLTISSSCIDSILGILEKGADVLVADNEMIRVIEFKQISSSYKLMYCNYFEFLELITNNKYFISGSIIVYIPDDNMMQKNILNIIDSIIKKHDMRFLLFSKEDYYLSFKKKNLSEIINGPCKQE